MSQYILLADEDKRIQTLMETAIRYFYPHDIEVIQGEVQFDEILKTRGHPQILIISSTLLFKDKDKLYSSLSSKEDILFPIIVTSLDPLHDFLSYPLISSWVAKPIDVEDFTSLIKSYTVVVANEIPSHIPVDMNILLTLERKDFDLYLKLSGKNFIKIVNRGASFTPEDAKKLKTKGISKLFIPASSCFALIREMQESYNSREIPTNSEEVLIISHMEQIERIGNAVGWSKEIIEESEKTVRRAIEVFKKSSDLHSVLENLLRHRETDFSEHVGLLSFVICALASQMRIPSENAAIKLALAALLHDLKVEPEIYQNAEEWNRKASTMEDRSSAVMNYRNHPLEGAQFIQKIDLVPPDIDRIILQHHERPDGTGFPRALSASRITYLAAVFIVCEELVHFIKRGGNLTTSLKDFMTWGEAYFDQAHFKNIFSEMKEIIKLKF
jgi:hypothetical protein